MESIIHIMLTAFIPLSLSLRLEYTQNLTVHYAASSLFSVHYVLILYCISFVCTVCIHIVCTVPACSSFFPWNSGFEGLTLGPLYSARGGNVPSDIDSGKREGDKRVASFALQNPTVTKLTFAKKIKRRQSPSIYTANFFSISTVKQKFLF